MRTISQSTYIKNIYEVYRKDIEFKTQNRRKQQQKKNTERCKTSFPKLYVANTDLLLKRTEQNNDTTLNNPVDTQTMLNAHKVPCKRLM